MPYKSLDGFEIFPWNKNFETGIHEIDNQHKQLVQILNQLAFYLGYNANEADLNTVFNELAAYADYHFKCEEVIWKKYFKDDASFQNHLHTHQSFIDEVMKLKEEEATQPIDDVIENILKFLSRWLAIHILNTDTVMAKTVLGIQSGLNLEEAKTKAENEMTGEKAVLIEAILQMYEQLSSRTLALMREKTGYLDSKKGTSVREPEIYCVVEEDFSIISWNQRFLEITGCTGEALVGKPFIDFVEEADQPEVIFKIEKTVGSHFGKFGCRIKGRDRKKTYYHFTLNSLLNHGKKTVLISGFKQQR